MKAVFGKRSVWKNAIAKRTGRPGRAACQSRVKTQLTMLRFNGLVNRRAVAKWSIGIGQPLWRRAMMAAGRRPDAGVPQRPRPAPDAHASLLKLPPPQI